jgi:hypothetical protein
VVGGIVSITGKPSQKDHTRKGSDMSENKNEKEVEETEGHGARFNGALPEEGDDEGTEGHGARFNGALPDEDDEGTEGHGVRVRI